MNTIESQAFSIAAHSRLALEENPVAALAVYQKLKTAIAGGATDLSMSDFEGAGNAAEDDDVLVGDMVLSIELYAQSLVDFGKSLLRAAHAGLIGAAIDGSLDSDANNWHLASLADANLDEAAEHWSQLAW